MAHSKKPTARKPATKFSQLRKQMEQNKVRHNVTKARVYKSGNR